ncbi:reverse transcriptase domain-containing protein, partial [bacterium]|nr:reverse transcriptase domain-containing protein [bacterium]
PEFDEHGARIAKDIKDVDSAPEQTKADGEADSLVEIKDDGDISKQHPIDEAALELRQGFPPEAPPSTPTADHVASRGGGGDDASGRGGDGSAERAEPEVTRQQEASRRPPAQYLIPRDHWPDDQCDEHEGRGWEVIIVKRSGEWALCKFVSARTAEGVPYADEWRRIKDLIPLSVEEPAAVPVPVAPPTHAGKSEEPLTAPMQPMPRSEVAPTPVPIGPFDDPVPNEFTKPAPGETNPMREPTRPTRERQQPVRLGYPAVTAVFGDRLTGLPPMEPRDTVCGGVAGEVLAFAARPAFEIGYSVAALAASYAEAAGVGFDVYSPRMPIDALYVETTHGADRLVAEAFDLAESLGEPMMLAAEREIRTAYEASPTELQRATMISCDHALVVAEYGSTSPQAILVRETYAVAMVDAACHGVVVPPLDPLLRVASGERLGEDVSMAAAFDGDLSGAFIHRFDISPGEELFGLAKARSNPDTYSERQMRGPEWDTPKQLEVAKIVRLGAKTDVAADDPSVKGMQVNEFTWVGRDKRGPDGTVSKKNARCAARGDMDKGRLDITSNDKTAPVARNTSMMDFDAVGCLRRMHMCDYDVPGAYLQGEQQPHEQRLYRPPVGFRTYDERGVAILWLSNHPFYGQTDAGAIWNRTINETLTSEKPPHGCGFARCPNDPSVYGMNVSDGELGGQVNNTLYVDDGRLSWDPGKAAADKAAEVKTKLSKAYGITFGKDDPEETHFLGANIIRSKDRCVTSIRATSYIDLQVKRYADGDVSSPKFPAHWSTLPADETLVREWEAAMATRTPASPELTKRYGSLFGSLLHATKFRPEISAALGLLGSCLTFPTEKLYECLMHVLVYLGRSRSMGTTFSAHVPGGKQLCVYADSNWNATRSTTGFCIMLAGAAISTASRRQHCITMSSCEAELVALCDAAIELLHTHAVAEFIGLEQSGPIEVCTDSKAAYDLCHRYTSAQNSRHVDRKLFKMRELRGAGVVRVRHIPGDTNPADLFTKILTRQPFEKHRKVVLNLPGNVGVETTRATSAASSQRDGTGAP